MMYFEFIKMYKEISKKYIDINDSKNLVKLDPTNVLDLWLLIFF